MMYELNEDLDKIRVLDHSHVYSNSQKVTKEFDHTLLRDESTQYKLISVNQKDY